jgi:hypothetical protein
VYLPDDGFQKPKHVAKYRQERYYVLYYCCVVTELVKRLNVSLFHTDTIPKILTETACYKLYYFKWNTIKVLAQAISRTERTSYPICRGYSRNFQVLQSTHGARYLWRVLTSQNSSNELFCAFNVLQQRNKQLIATLEPPNCENSVREQWETLQYSNWDQQTYLYMEYGRINTATVLIKYSHTVRK